MPAEDRAALDADALEQLCPPFGRWVDRDELDRLIDDLEQGRNEAPDVDAPDDEPETSTGRQEPADSGQADPEPRPAPRQPAPQPQRAPQPDPAPAPAPPPAPDPPPDDADEEPGPVRELLDDVRDLVPLP